MSIRDIISQSGKTREQICREAGISRGHLSLLENNLRKVGLQKLRPLADVLGVHPSVLRPDLYAALNVAPLSGAE